METALAPTLHVPVLILATASAAPGKIRAFHKVLLKVGHVLSGSTNPQHPHPKGARPSKLIRLGMPGRAPAGPSLRMGYLLSHFHFRSRIME